ncbi:type III secretion regulator YopN/LcrE/InvE/MxiC [Candidatus Rubidus massiliensis]|nr:MAG: hypothetical protein BGO10_09530 [Chlamydia sp. 32-24]CDZ80698.1 type III secretion regulator YopN/LcrE/InvE/MxiC [Candidatus Rubidus massiliensis]
MAQVSKTTNEKFQEVSLQKIITDDQAVEIFPIDDSLFDLEEYDSELQEHKRLLNQRSESKEKVIIRIPSNPDEEADHQSASKFCQENREHEVSELMRLRRAITGKRTQEILDIVLRLYPDAHLASEAFDFLLTLKLPDQLKVDVLEAKNIYEIRYKREIEEGHKLAHAAAIAAAHLDEKSGKEIDPKHFRDLRELYHEVVHGQYDFPVLFGKLTKFYSFNELHKIIKYMYRELGREINKLKGDKTEERPLLINMAKQIRNLQALIGVFRTFEKVQKHLNRLGVD